MRSIDLPEVGPVTEDFAKAGAVLHFCKRVEHRGVRHVELASSTRGVSFLSDLRASAEFWREIRKLRPTVLHTHNPKPGIYGRILGRLAGVPIVVNTLHGFYATETDPFLKRLVVYVLEAIASRFSDAELLTMVDVATRGVASSIHTGMMARCLRKNARTSSKPLV